MTALDSTQPWEVRGTLVLLLMFVCCPGRKKSRRVACEWTAVSLDHWRTIRRAVRGDTRKAIETAVKESSIEKSVSLYQKCLSSILSAKNDLRKFVVDTAVGLLSPVSQ